MHPQSRCWQMLDYVLVWRRDRRNVLGTKAIRDANGWTDHHLVISQMRLRLQPRRRPQDKRRPVPAVVTQYQPLVIAIAQSPHTSAWSFTHESIAWWLVNQCLGLPHAVAAPASTALTAPAPLHTALAYQDTCASTKTYGKPPEAKPHQRTPSKLKHRQHPHNHHKVPDTITVS
ncbi:unnamed protein product [Schistocephalus solidus]|uniref:Endo/exonuclease/phosphatase domain-containing protein n=1 Tax=Schistocephalus solidus TaxID=70667 RepID=A0A183T1F9_SCHSO|nr:unnamed protein product [Schistocephalus solidus]